MKLFGGNSTCPLPKDETSLLLKGEPVAGSLTFQHILLIVSIACTGIVAFISYFLVFKHLHRYTQPKQQRQIIRIVFTPLVFSVFSALSILNYSAAIYLIPLRDLYETFALASLFLLFTEYVAPDPETRDAFFYNLENRKKRGSMFSRSKEYDVIPGGSLKWFKTKWVYVFGYCIAMVVTTIAQEITQAAKVFCVTSYSPRFANIWITIIQNVAVTVAVTAVINYYARLYPQMLEHKPLGKLISFKLIVGINFIQTLLFSLLTGNNVLKGTHKVTGKDLSIGIPAVLVSFEQVLFAIGFHYSFRSREYHESEKPFAKRMGIFRAAAHAFNPSDLLNGMFTAVKLLLGGGIIGKGGASRIPGRGPQRVGTYGQSFEQDNVHLEPLAGMGGVNNGYTGGYGYSNGRPSTEDPNTYLAPAQGGYQRSRSASQTYRPPPGYESVENPEMEGLYPAKNVSSYSRDPSLDERRPKDMV